ncbi:MAG: PVC-type heme-binding CxxCH protein [Gemmatimonadota bacterium]
MNGLPAALRAATLHAVVLLLAGCGRPELPPPALQDVVRSEEPRRIDVLFLGRDDTLHDARAVAPLIAGALGREGINIDYAEALPTDEGSLALFDAVIVYAESADDVLERSDALRTYVEAGGGLLAIHEGGVHVADAASFAGGQMPQDSGSTRSHGGGRIFGTRYGHDAETWRQSSFQRLVRGGILWAVGDQVRGLLAEYDVPLLVYEDAPVPIPNYEGAPEPLRLQRPLPPGDAVRQWQVPPGFELVLFAAEPEVVNPIAMTWDERGRLWVVETVDYPNNIVPDGEGNDVVRILEDTDGDGRADTSKIFADGLSIPTGIVFANGGVILSNAPRFLFLKDTDGDDRADVREEIMTGWSVADTHSGPSNLQYGFDNWIWGAVGDAGFAGDVGGEKMQFEDAIYRFRPDGSELEIVARYSNNTWGLGFTESFDLFANTANNEHSVFIAIPQRYYEGVRGLRGAGWARIDGHYARHTLAPTRQVDYFGGFTAAGGHHFYSARSYPREYWNRIAFVHEATGGLVHRAVIDRAGSGFRETDGWNLVASADEWSAPVHAEVGPDGAVWILDWYSFIKQHNPTPPGFETGAGGAYETPLRDRQHGRIYRLVWKGAPAYAPLSLSADRPDELVDALRHDNMFWRRTAQRLLVDRGDTDVLGDLYRITGDRRVDELGLNAPAVHAIWTLHGLGALDGSNARAERAVREALDHPAAGVRRNAILALPRNERTFEYLEDAGSLADDDLNVRLQALLAIAELEPSAEIGRALFELGRDRAVPNDEWLPTALYLAASRHAAGFMAAYADDAGALEVARLAGRAARGELDDVVDWSDAALDDSAWDTIRVPAHWTTTKLAHFPGVVWFRRAVDVPAAGAGAAATLYLGPISDRDIAYVNGQQVGTTDNQPGTEREYAIPAGVLHAGRNVVAVEVTNQRRGGGIYGADDLVRIDGAGFSVPLAGQWRYRKAAEWRGGRRPDFSAGIPFEQQFLRYYDPAGAPAGSAERDDIAEDVAATVELGTVPGQNRFDRDTITVRAGQRIAIAFDNTDGMLHNVVVLGEAMAQQEVGAMLNAYVSDASASGSDFIPPRLPVLARSPMTSPRESLTFVITVPDEPGDYPILCTVPGHWMTMWATLRVLP